MPATPPTPPRRTTTATARKPQVNSAYAQAARRQRAARLRARLAVAVAQGRQFTADAARAKTTANPKATASSKAAVKAKPPAVGKTPAATRGQGSAVRRVATKPPVPPAKTLPQRTKR
ncbi:hypothetical protein [Frankia sp. R82]|uniref:hypothetical protein n=1 Tax=Frankia sp. R82 TaxID=2950553 RepID=UPI002042BFB5|nr:hypothetical protein [Frankia sp. R82]MCM3886122.1 hypothetical protein [Frankia sp. R82]